MKKNICFYVLLIGISFLSSKALSQEVDFAPIGAKWWFSSYCLYNLDCGYFTMTSTKDTLIENKSARIIEIDTFGGEGWSMDATPLIVYTNDNKVYNFDRINNEFYVLYDFGLQAGDTLTIQDSTKFRGFINPEDGSEQALFQVVVDSNVIKPFSNDSLIHLYTSPTTNSSYFFNSPIIERIGNVSSLLGETTLQAPGGYPSFFRCYKDQIIDLTNDNCEYISTLNTLEITKNEFSVYPNIVKDLLHIEWESNSLPKSVSIHLYNTLGNCVYKNKIIPSDSTFTINMKDFSEGMYILNVVSDKKRYNFKIIK